MEFLTVLWLPIILSTVFVFIVSSVIHMVLPYHRSDVSKIPNEDGILDTMRAAKVGRIWQSPHFRKPLNWMLVSRRLTPDWPWPPL